MKLNKKVVIFDLDGTLLYTLEDLADSVNYALSQFDCQVCSLSQIRSFVGNGVRKLIERAVDFGGNLLNDTDFEKCLSLFKEHYKNNMYNKTQPYTGVEEMLKDLKSIGIKTAVVSNKFDVAVKELCEYYFGDLIDIAVGESDVICKKPEPDGILKVVKEFCVKVDDCVYIGDSEVDIQTAQNCKMDLISVDWGYKDKAFLLKNGADIIISSSKELLDFLK